MIHLFFLSSQVVARAVRDFKAAEGEGEVPFPGILPDMTASNDGYDTTILRYYETAILRDYVKESVH